MTYRTVKISQAAPLKPKGSVHIGKKKTIGKKWEFTIYLDALPWWPHTSRYNFRHIMLHCVFVVFSKHNERTMEENLQTTLNLENQLSDLAIFSDFLTKSRYHNEFCMNITMAQGFLYAVTSSPCSIMPSDWTVIIFGGIPEFESIEQQKNVYEATLALYAAVESKLTLCDKKTDLLLWREGGRKVNLLAASNKQLVDFCSGYIKGYLLDPILRKTFTDIPDLSFAFFISIIKLGAADGEIGEIDEVMRKTLQHVIVENYLNWLEVKKLNLCESVV